MTRIVRAPYVIDGDVPTQQLIGRYRELREWRNHADGEMDEIKKKLAAVMDEHGAQELVHDRVAVARLTEYDLETADTKSLKQRFPKVYARFVRLTPVRRVDVP